MDVNKHFENLIKLDKFCDYVPILSTVTNLVDIIIAKIVFKNDSVTSNTYFNYLKSKNDNAGWGALIPFAAIRLRDSKAPNAEKTSEVAAKRIYPQAADESVSVVESDTTVKTETTYEEKVDAFIKELKGSEGEFDFARLEHIKRSIINDNILNLYGSNLTVLPKEIWNLTNLTKLDLGNNRLTA